MKKRFQHISLFKNDEEQCPYFIKLTLVFYSMRRNKKKDNQGLATPITVKNTMITHDSNVLFTK